MKCPFATIVMLLAFGPSVVLGQPPATGQPADAPAPPAARDPADDSTPSPETPTQQQPPPADEEPAAVWALEGIEWDFEDVTSVYQPVRGIFLTETRSSVWMLELVRELFPGEAGLHSALEETPFRLVLLDEERSVVDVELPLKATAVTGRIGDRVLLSVLMPEDGTPEDDSLAKVRTIRVQRRTEVGFPPNLPGDGPVTRNQPIVVEEP